MIFSLSKIHLGTTRVLTSWVVAITFCLLSQSVIAQEQAKDSDRTGYLVKVPLPIDNRASTLVKQALKSIADNAPLAVRPEEFPTIIIEFDTSGGKTGRGSELEACQALARYLVGPELKRIQTIAYVPAVAGSELIDEDSETGQLKGHAVLVAIAANQLLLGQNTSIGQASADEPKVDPLIVAIYKNIAEQRPKFPLPVVMSMLEDDRSLFRVVKVDGSAEFVDREALEKLEAAGQANETRTISPAGQPAFLTSEQLIDFNLARSAPKSRTDLARLLDLAPNSLERDLASGETWKAILIRFADFVDPTAAKWTTRSLRQGINQNNFNMVIVELDHCDGDFNACLRLAQELTDRRRDLRTVAYVNGYATGPAAVLALSCDHLILHPEARLGGRLEDQTEPLSEGDLNEFQPLIVELATKNEADWSLMMSMLDPSLIVTNYRHRESGQTRLLSNDEFSALDDRNQWAPLGPVGGMTGINSATAERLGIARAIADDMTAVEKFYQLEEAPRLLQASKTDRWLEDFAAILSSPFVAPWLLFAGFFFFSTEMSAPGTGLPGFLATICFVLFFWSQFLDGNADWVEVILFILGGVFVAIEVFVIPGFGIFGIGGLIMIITSLVLASQSFVVPMTSEQIRQLPYSMMPVVGAGLGIVCAAYALRNVIPNAPYLRRLMLDPNKSERTNLEGTDPEAIVDWSDLLNQTGVTTTRLFPAGKARISGKIYDVISKGQMIDKGQAIVVVEAQGNRVVVTATENDVS